MSPARIVQKIASGRLFRVRVVIIYLARKDAGKLVFRRTVESLAIFTYFFLLPKDKKLYFQIEAQNGRMES